jgi:hypothetical protein
MDFPSNPPLPLFVHTYTRWGPANEYRAIAAANLTFSVSITWPVANTAFYMPVVLPWAFPVRRVFWANGSSVTSTNMDFGIYTAEGTRLYSTGSTAASGVSAVQYVTPGTDLLLSPGTYYFALADSTTTANRGGMGATTATVLVLRKLGVLQQATALALPANMTGAAVTNSCLPFCGVTRTTTGF